MLADVRAGPISSLVFSKLARLARNTKELLEFAEVFRTEGADLVCLQESRHRLARWPSVLHHDRRHGIDSAETPAVAVA